MIEETKILSEPFRRMRTPDPFDGESVLPYDESSWITGLNDREADVWQNCSFLDNPLSLRGQ
jgi:hypothetical protein